MDKVKEKLLALRTESDANAARAEKAEAENKELEQKLLLKEQENTSLTHKISVLEGDIEKIENNLKEAKSASQDGEGQRDTNETLRRRVDLLEDLLDTESKNLHEMTQKCREYDIKADHFTQQLQRKEAEREDWEKKYDQAQEKFLASKRELEELSSQLDSI